MEAKLLLCVVTVAVVAQALMAGTAAKKETNEWSVAKDLLNVYESRGVVPVAQNMNSQLKIEGLRKWQLKEYIQSFQMRKMTEVNCRKQPCTFINGKAAHEECQEFNKLCIVCEPDNFCNSKNTERDITSSKATCTDLTCTTINEEGVEKYWCGSSNGCGECDNSQGERKGKCLKPSSEEKNTEEEINEATDDVVIQPLEEVSDEDLR